MFSLLQILIIHQLNFIQLSKQSLLSGLTSLIKFDNLLYLSGVSSLSLSSSIFAFDVGSSTLNLMSQSSYSSKIYDAEVWNTSQSTGVNGGFLLPLFLRVVNGVNETLFLS